VCLVLQTANAVEADPFAETVKLQFAYGLACPQNHGGRLSHRQSLGAPLQKAKNQGIAKLDHLSLGRRSMEPINDWVNCGAPVRPCRACRGHRGHCRATPGPKDKVARKAAARLRRNKQGRLDAKSVRIDNDGCIVLARRNAEPYDPECIDRLMLLH
jgi:hypothetical protein